MKIDSPQIIGTEGAGLGIGITTPAADLHISGSTADADILRIQGGSSEILFASGSGNVGIGTVTPDTKLHILQSAADINSGIKIVGSDDVISGRIWMEGGHLHLDNATAGANTGITVDDTGKIGIGTASPSDKLHVSGSSILLRNGTSDVDLKLGIAGYGMSLTYGTGLLRFRTNVTDRMVIDNSGNVGIGTTSPASLLHVSSSAANPVRITTNSSTNSALLIGNTSTGDAVITLDASNGDFAGTDYFTIRHNNDLTADIFTQTNAGILNLGSKGTTNAITIDGTKVGIGTTSPDAKLHVHDSSTDGDLYVTNTTTATSASLFVGYWNQSSIYQGLTISRTYGSADITFDVNQNGALKFSQIGVERMRVHTNGNVGIGATNPTRTLEVASASGPNFQLKRTGFSGYTYIEDDGSNSIYRSYGATIFQTNGENDRMRIDSSGRVGVGVTPSSWGAFTYPIDVGPGSAFWNPGSATQTQILTNSYNDGTNFRYKGTGGASRYRQIGNQHEFDIAASGTAGNIISFTPAMTIDPDGDVGINRTSPGARLDVLANSNGVAARLRNENATNGYGLIIETEGTASTRYALILRNLTESVIYGGVSTATGQVGFWGIGASPTGTLGNRLTVNGSASIGSGSYLTTAAPSNGLIVQGNVGIGTTNAIGAKLVVVGGMDIGASDTGYTARFFTLQNSTLGSTPNIWVAARGYLNDYAQIGLGYIGGNLIPPVIIGSQTTSQSTYTKGNFFIATRDVVTDTTPTIRMLVTTDGKVGINETSPDTNLHVVGVDRPLLVEGSGPGYTQGAITLTSGTDNSPEYRGQGIYLFNEGQDVTWYIGTNYADADTFSINRRASTTSLEPATAQNGFALLKIKSDGSVGIGVNSNPSHKLEIRNDVAATTDLDPTAIKLYNNSDGGSAIEFSNGVGGNSKISFGVESTGAGTDDTDITFSTSANAATVSPRMRITSGGRVGIGTTSPESALHIASSTTSAVGGVTHNGVVKASYKGSKAGSSSVTIRIWISNYTTGMVNFMYAHTNDGDGFSFAQVFVNNSYGRVRTQTVSSKLTNSFVSPIAFAVGSDNPGGNNNYVQFTIPAGNSSSGFYSVTVEGHGNASDSGFWFQVL